MRLQHGICFQILLVCTLITSITACNRDPNAAVTAKSSRSLMPADPALKTLYIQSCYSCHSAGAGNAPRSGNIADWAPRVQKGLDVLLHNTINGIGGMPPRGMCIDCSEEEFVKLILFLAGQSD